MPSSLSRIAQLFMFLLRLSSIRSFRSVQCPRTSSALFASNDASSSSGNTKRIVESLLGSTIQRAKSTLTNNKADSEQESGTNVNFQSGNSDTVVDTTQRNNVEDILQATISRSERIVKGASETTTTTQPEEISTSKFRSSRRYRGNPAITNTALAHTLWESVLRPKIDSAIDATCGNGHDSVALAKMLFGEETGDQEDSQSHLLCMDIQEQACSNTTAALQDQIGPEFLEKGQIEVIQASHAPLPWPTTLPSATVSLALVVYNLGWLPKSGNKDSSITKTDTTLYSMVDAMLRLRLGGMISVVTYPKTNPEEDLAVRIFLECAALLSSNVLTWEDFLEDDLESSVEMKRLIQDSMQRLVADGERNQTWRVSEHKKLGMDRAPILLTATRIK